MTAVGKHIRHISQIKLNTRKILIVCITQTVKVSILTNGNVKTLIKRKEAALARNNRGKKLQRQALVPEVTINFNLMVQKYYDLHQIALTVARLLYCKEFLQPTFSWFNNKEFLCNTFLNLCM